MSSSTAATSRSSSGRSRRTPRSGSSSRRTRFPGIEGSERVPEDEPRTIADFEERAAAILEEGPYGYYAGGAGDELTLDDNVQAWRRIAIRTRVLVDVSERDASTTLLGRRRPHPILVAPTAYHPGASGRGGGNGARCGRGGRGLLPLVTRDVPARGCCGRRPGWHAVVPALRVPGPRGVVRAPRLRGRERLRGDRGHRGPPRPGDPRARRTESVRDPGCAREQGRDAGARCAQPASDRGAHRSRADVDGRRGVRVPVRSAGPGQGCADPRGCPPRVGARSRRRGCVEPWRPPARHR